MRRVRAMVSAALAVGAFACSGPPDGARVCALEEGERAHGPAACTSGEGRTIALRALREETVAFQVVVEDPATLLDGVTIDAPAFRGDGGDALPVDVFVEHFVDVEARSRNARDGDAALPFTLAARPLDRDVRGPTPDALVPLGIAACRGALADREFCPYPRRIAPGGRGAFYVEVFVPRSAAPGKYSTRVTLRRRGVEVGAVDATLDVARAVLPFEASGFFAFEAFDSLEERFGDPVRVERSLLQLLHAHHVEGFPAVTEEKHVERLGPALDGSLFTATLGYRGPGAGVPLSILPIGAYGSLGKPTGDAVVRAKRIAGRIPKETETFVYAIDERCESSMGPDWIRELERLYVGPRLRVGATCDKDPIDQRVDVVMTPAQAFDHGKAVAARKPVYAYNGRLPWAGPLMLDAPLGSLTANGWIGAAHGVPRWFFWETIFWNDGNAGGEGPRDPFVDPETFHNADGDAALLDGLLVYPGRSPFTSDLGVDAVLPSMRLKALRRGALDAGLIALAASRDPAKTREVVSSIASGSLSDTDPDAATRFVTDSTAMASARNALRDIVGDGDLELSADEVRASLARIPVTTTRAVSGSWAHVFPLIAGATLTGFAAVIVGLVRRRRVGKR